MTITQVQAIYRNGTLRLDEKLDLPDNTLVTVQVTALDQSKLQKRSLFGAFPELATLTKDDFTWAKQLWEKGVEKQTQISEESS